MHTVQIEIKSSELTRLLLELIYNMHAYVPATRDVVKSIERIFIVYEQK